MSLTDPTRALVIQSIAFPNDDTIEVTFLEKRDQNEAVGMVKSMFIDIRRARCRQEAADLLELAEDIVDAGLLAQRAPEQELDPRKRFSRKRDIPRLDDEDDEEDYDYRDRDGED